MTVWKLVDVICRMLEKKSKIWLLISKFAAYAHLSCTKKYSSKGA